MRVVSATPPHPLEKHSSPGMMMAAQWNLGTCTLLKDERVWTAVSDRLSL